MSFEAFHSEYAQGRVYWLVVYLKKPATSLAFSSTMLDRVQPSANDANIVVDLHTPGINVTIAAGKVIRVMVQNLGFELDCTQGVKLVEDPAMRFQLQVEIKERTKQEFAVEVTFGTNEDDTPAVREVMDLICERVDAIEMSYPEEDERERHDSHEDLKILAVHPAWLDRYKITCQTYSYCACVVGQPHSYNNLQRSVELLKKLDKNETEERTNQVLVAYMSLRVFDMIEEEFGLSHHPSWKNHRQVVSDALNELQVDERLDKGLRARLKDIIAYQERKLSRDSVECLTDLKVPK